MAQRRFLGNFILALLAYAGCVLVSSHYLPSLPAGAGKTALALLPVPAMLMMAWVVIEHLRSLDELARRIQLEALGLAFVGTALLTFSYGFLETAGYPRLSMFMVWSLMGSLWAIGAVVGVRRYR